MLPSVYRKWDLTVKPCAGTINFRDTSRPGTPPTIGEGTGIVSFGPEVVARITSVCGIGEVAFTTMTILLGPAAWAFTPARIGCGSGNALAVAEPAPIRLADGQALPAVS